MALMLKSMKNYKVGNLKMKILLNADEEKLYSDKVVNVIP